MFAEKLGHGCPMRNQGKHGQPDLVRFSQVVKARREALGLTQEQVSALGGPSDTTFTKIENLEWRPGRPATLAKLDAGLQWKPGSSARILYEGGDPIPTDNAPLPLTKTAETGPADIAIELTLALETGVQGLWSALAELVPQLPSSVTRSLDDLDSAAYLAERLALQLAGSGEEFAHRRRELRARARSRVDGTDVQATERTPAPSGAGFDMAFPGPDDLEIVADINIDDAGS